MKHNTKSILSLILIPIMSLSLLLIPSDAFYKNHVVYAYSEQEELAMYGDEYTKYGSEYKHDFRNTWNTTSVINIASTPSYYAEVPEYHLQYQADEVIGINPIYDFDMCITNDAANPAPILIVIRTSGAGIEDSNSSKESVAYSTIIEPGQTINTGNLPMNLLASVTFMEEPINYSICFYSDVPGDYLINISTEDPKIYE